MSVTVTDSDGDSQTFVDANSWHVDELKQLHLRSSSNKQVASFAAHGWNAVGMTEPTTPPRGGVA